MLLTNIYKLNVTRLPYELDSLAVDIAGSLSGTVPSAKELESKINLVKWILDID